MKRSIYLLDTNIVSYLMRKEFPEIGKHIARIVRLNGEIAMSAIASAELEFGVLNAKSEKKRVAYEDELIRTRMIVRPLEWPLSAAKHFAEIRLALQKRGELVGMMDALIAAHALAIDATLVTNNEREFKRVPGLKVENWTK
jgi:tRNA(fMet)-specific endonuclease VapC